MRALLLTFVVSAGLATAQSPAAATANNTVKTYSSASDVAALLAKAKAEHKDGQALVVERILQLAPYNANLEYRASVGPAAVHETEAEMFYVIDGSATMMTGGKLVDEKRTNAANLSGTAIAGGETRVVSKGDFIIVPEGTPHWFGKIDSPVTLMTIHVPRPVPAAR